MLNLRIQPDDYGNVELICVAKCGGFSGGGAAWFSPSDIKIFAQGLKELSEFTTDQAELRGGPIEPVEQHTVALTAYPTDALGHFGLHVTLGQNPFDGDRKKQASRVSLELALETASLARLGDEILRLIDGELHEVQFAT